MKCRYPLVAVLFAAACAGYALVPQQDADHRDATTPKPSSVTKSDQVKTATAQNTLASLKGALLAAELDGGLNAKKLKAGDEVKAVLTQALVIHGKIVAPVDSKLIGHVTEATPKTDDTPRCRLGVVFDKLLLKHHRQVEFQATVQVLAPPARRRSRVDRPSQMLPPSMIGMGRGGGSPSPIGGGGGGFGGGGVGGGGFGGPQPAPSGGGSMSGVDRPDASVRVGGSLGDIGGARAASAPRTLSESNRPLSAARGIVPGVYGIKHLALGKDGRTPGHVILSSKSTVKLEDGTQVLLRITGPPVRN